MHSELGLHLVENPHQPEMFRAIEIVHAVYARDQATTKNFQKLRIHHQNSAIHTYEVATILTAAAIKLGWNEEKVEFMTRVGLWHDIGKSETKEALLSAKDLKANEKEEIQFGHMKQTLEIINREIEDPILARAMLRIIMAHHSILPNGDGGVYLRRLLEEFGKERRTPPSLDEIEMQLLLALADKTARIMYGYHEDREPDPERVKTELAHYKELADIHPNIGVLVDTVCEIVK